MWGAQEVRQRGSRDRDREVDCAAMLKTELYSKFHKNPLAGIE